MAEKKKQNKTYTRKYSSDAIPNGIYKRFSFPIKIINFKKKKRNKHINIM